MDFIKDQAEKYLGGDQEGNQQGSQQGRQQYGEQDQYDGGQGGGQQYGGGQQFGGQGGGQQYGGQGGYGGQQQEYGGQGGYGGGQQEFGGQGGYGGQPQAGGFGGQQDDDGHDWSQLGNLFHHAKAADNSGDGDFDVGSFVSRLTGGRGDQVDVAEAARAQNADPSMIDRLMDLYQKQTGSQFDNSPSAFDTLTNLASSKTGSSVSRPLMEKLVRWKLQQMF